MVQNAILAPWVVSTISKILVIFCQFGRNFLTFPALNLSISSWRNFLIVGTSLIKWCTWFSKSWRISSSDSCNFYHGFLSWGMVGNCFLCFCWFQGTFVSSDYQHLRLCLNFCLCLPKKVVVCLCIPNHTMRYKFDLEMVWFSDPSSLIYPVRNAP